MKRTNVMHVLNELPKEFPLDDLFERLLVIEKIDQGLLDMKKGKTITHAKVKKTAASWRK